MTRSDNHFIHIEMENYQPYDVVCTRQVSGWVFGNVVFGGFIGVAIDYVSGGIYQLTPDQVQAEMRKSPYNMCKKSDDSYITIVMSPDPAWKKIGTLTPQENI